MQASKQKRAADFIIIIAPTPPLLADSVPGMNSAAWIAAIHNLSQASWGSGAPNSFLLELLKNVSTGRLLLEYLKQ